MKRLYWLGVLLLVGLGLLLVLAGCNKPAETPKAETPAATTAPPATEAPKAEVAKHFWGSFGVGSWVKMSTTTHMKGVPPTETETTQTLTALDADNATVKMETKMGPAPVQATEMKFPLKAEAAKMEPTKEPAPAPKTGTETLTIGGKTYDCKWTELESKGATGTTLTKTWTCETVPGFSVKSVTKMSGQVESETTSEIIDFEAKAK